MHTNVLNTLVTCNDDIGGRKQQNYSMSYVHK